MNSLSLLLRQLVIVAALVAAASPAAAQSLPNFSLPTAHPAPAAHVQDVATGDLNGDGRVDVVATRNGGGEIGVNVSLGDGTGQLTFLSTFGSGQRVNSVALADFNNDSRLDAVTANFNGGNGSTFSVLFGDGTGALGGEVTYAFTNATKVATGDFNNDGSPDVVVMNGATLSVFVNNGSGALSAAFTRPYSTPNCCTYSGYSDVAVGDTNQDGKQDLAISVSTYDYGGEPQIQVMRGLGNGTFQATLYYRYPNHPTIGRPVGYHTTSIAVADVTGDLWPDLVLGAQRTWTPSGSPSAVVVMRNQAGAFPQSQGTVHYLPDIYGAGASVGDLNDDSFLDIVAPISNGALGYFLNDGVGGFSSNSVAIWGMGYVASVELADLNSSGPGTLDVVMSRYYGPVITVLNGTPAIPCAAGSYSATGNQPCAAADPGSFVAASGATAQTSCPIGTFSSVAGAVACTPAPAGFFVPSAGATSATACAPGYGSAAGATSCYALDNDGDGVNNDVDAYPNSNMNATVTVGTCGTGVTNQVMPNGATFNDLVAAIGGANHGAKVSGVSELSNSWKSAGLISGRDHGAIVSCTAKSK